MHACTQDPEPMEDLEMGNANEAGLVARCVALLGIADICDAPVPRERNLGVSGIQYLALRYYLPVYM